MNLKTTLSLLLTAALATSASSAAIGSCVWPCGAVLTV